MKENEILNKHVLDVIREQYDKIFSAEKKVADFVLQNPQKTVESNVSELAKCSGVSDATVVRMCHHIGYKGYYQFRISLASDIGKKHYQGTGVINGEGAVERLFKDYADNMLVVGRRITDDTIDNCVKLVKACNTVHIIAVGNTSVLSQYMGFRLGRLGVKCSFGLTVEYYMNHINLANEDDLIVAISKSGTSKPVILGMELAKEKNLKCIAVTAHIQSPVSELADEILLSQERETSFNYYKDYAQTNMMATIDAFLDFLINEEVIERKRADKPEILLSEYKM